MAVNSSLQLEKVAIAIIQQAIDLVLTLHDDDYTYTSKVMPAGTIGKHIRYNRELFFSAIGSYIAIDMYMIILICYKSPVQILTSYWIMIYGQEM